MFNVYSHNVIASYIITHVYFQDIWQCKTISFYVISLNIVGYICFQCVAVQDKTEWLYVVNHRRDHDVISVFKGQLNAARTVSSFAFHTDLVWIFFQKKIRFSLKNTVDLAD